ncbi:MAG: chemotaxis protein CheV [Nitrospirae bacterium]|nr:chemotaxis protein CheV [Nitrospirota bacterium]
MDDMLAEVDQRTNLALSNQMEMLTFYLTDEQLYGINVFKIVEVIECTTKITKIPNSHPAVKGTINFRGSSVAVIDLSEALAMPPVDYKSNVSYIIICEYNDTVQGFLISAPDTLINKSWEEIKSPTGFISASAYLTALAFLEDERTVQILDVEKILAEIIGIEEELSEEIAKENEQIDLSGLNVLVVDDSRAARFMIQHVLDHLGVKSTVMDSAITALRHLEKLALEGGPIKDKLHLIISDIEMPGMDGFTFVRKLRANPKLKDLYVVVHSSLSNSSNIRKATQVGANDFLPKFNPDEIAKMVFNVASGKRA